MSDSAPEKTTEYALRVNRNVLFDALRKMEGDTSTVGCRLIECLLAEEVRFGDAIGLHIYGIELSPAAKPKVKTEPS